MQVRQPEAFVDPQACDGYTGVVVRLPDPHQTLEDLCQKGSYVSKLSGIRSSHC